MTPPEHSDTDPAHGQREPASVPIEAQAVELTLAELALACRIDPDWIVARVSAGLIEIDTSGGPARWRFADLHLARVRCMISMERTMDANPELAALVADLIEEVRSLRARLGARR